MKEKFDIFWYNILFYLGTAQECWMALRFNVSHYIRHGRRPVKMSPEMYRRFKIYVDENYRKQ